MERELTILIIEDNPGDMYLLKELLQAGDITVNRILEASTLQQGLSIINTQNTDLVFLDLFLPDSNGLETFITLNRSAPSTPVAVLSGLADSETALKTIKLGAQEYIVKGDYDERLLSKVVRYSIERNTITQNMIMQKVSTQRRIAEAAIRSQEQEKEELGRELHDNINQLLATSKMLIDISMKNTDMREELLPMCFTYINDAIEEIRKLSKSLVPPSLDEMGLREALQDLLISTAVTGNLRFTLDAAELDGKKVNNHIQLMLYRIAQEQISNILKYANATEARVKLSANDQYIRLIISDNGVGFDTTARRSGIGLKNIKNRARLYGGAVKIISSPGQGCTLKVIIPVK